MATSLRLITSNLITRSFPPTVVSASRFLTTMAKDDLDDQSSLRIPFPKISSMSLMMNMNGNENKLSLELPNEGLDVDLKMPGFDIEDMRACAEDRTSSKYIKEEKKDGVLRVTLPNKDDIKMANFINNILAGLCDNTAERTSPYHDFYGQSSLRITCPKISSAHFSMSMSSKMRRFKLDTPDGGLSVKLEMPARQKIYKDTRACAENNTSSDVKEETKDDIMANFVNNIIAGFRDITTERGWPYYDMFLDRSILGKGLCPMIAKLSRINSFSIHKEETDESIYIRMCMPGNEKIKLTKQGLRVSLFMYELEREDVKTFFDYDTFFIEGKTKNHHYITGIHVPEGVNMKHNMIKREKEDAVFYAFLPCTGKMEELPMIL